MVWNWIWSLVIVGYNFLTICRPFTRMATINRLSESRVSSNENSPDSLLLTCVKYVIDNSISIESVSLPQEICDLLIKVSDLVAYSGCVIYHESRDYFTKEYDLGLIALFVNQMAHPYSFFWFGILGFQGNACQQRRRKECLLRIFVSIQGEK